ncbi:flagellar hook-associated protein K [Roseobacter sp. SK209-2-6]|uniref:flagellar hook-associated protein FlgK n=1 Tax=Roseobacter sp. SK209-2-6 TaxID=388739 RepID=UPI0000F3D0EA|nr:flagellar hook-associated protein FlgK [Roseobacter sp. SK209-2-6]EBA17063.1 flagellar hook-associated protein K [Roseobacter sp. SK209-2-6]
MTITSAINSAMSGLTANARSSQVVSENLANALTPGYSAQRLNLSTNSYTGGTKVDGVERLIDPALQASARTAEAEHSAAETYANFYSRMSSLVGVVDDDTSISAQVSNFDSALIEAVSRPDSTERLHQLSVQADLVVKTITHAADGLNALRVEAETSINSQVRTLNNSLKEIEKLNARIVVSEAAGTSTTAMQDQRDKLIDEVNKIIPVNVLSRSQGRVALYSEGGVALIDGRASEITFDALQTIEPHMTLDNGLLNGLEVNGKLIDTSADGPLRGGTLAAQFDIRDSAAVEAQNDLDALAQDLVERFQDPALDATLGATDAGIFTDAGGFFDNTVPANTVGLSARLELNSSVSLSGAAETWRFRDGINAASQGDPGNASLLTAYSDRLAETRSVSTTKLGAITGSLNTLSASVMSRFARDSDTANSTMSFAAASFSEMSKAKLALGVDSDAELQNLMIIERAYAANAKMLEAVDEMMQTLLRI